MSIRSVRAITVFVMLGILAGLAQAGERFDAQDQESRILSDRVYLTLGGYAVDFNTTAQVGLGGIFGTFIRLEDQLRLQEDQQDLIFDGFYRITPRKTLHFTYLALTRDAVTVLDETIEFKDRVFNLGAVVASDFDSTLFKLTYRYGFINNGKVNTGVAAGLSFYNYNIALAGEATIDDGMGMETTEFAQVGEDLIIPIPTVGFFIDYAVTKKLIFQVRADFLDLDVGDFSGKLIDTRMTLDYFFTKNFGIGVGLGGTDLNVSKSGEDPFDIGYEYSGLLFYLGGAF